MRRTGWCLWDYDKSEVIRGPFQTIGEADAVRTEMERQGEKRNLWVGYSRTDPPQVELKNLCHHELVKLFEEIQTQQVVWAGVLESCLPTDEGYDEDTEAVLKNVIGSMKGRL